MDNSVISTLIGVAVGAISSSIPKLWDYLFENKKHKQANQRLYFERKLNVLQAYVAACSQLSASHFNNAVAIEQIKRLGFSEEQNATVSMVINNINNSNKASQNIVQQMADLSSSVSMFIDLKIDEQASYDLIKSIHEDIAKLGNIKSEVDSVIEKYDLKSEPVKETPVGKEYFQKKDAYHFHLQTLANNYNRVKINMNECIKKVRAEFVKYED